jgi:2-methylisocitrate lyase-like PEP mutase family enzyme
VYLEAGADVTFVEAPQSEEEIAAIPQRLPGPQVINMVQGGRTPLLGLEELEGYAIALYSNAALQGAIYGMQNVLGHLHEHGSMAGVLDEIAGWDERQRIVGRYVFEKLDEKYAAQSDRR